MATAPQSCERHPLSTGSSARGAQPKITAVRLGNESDGSAPCTSRRTAQHRRVHRAGASTPSPATRPSPSSPSRRGGVHRFSSLSLSLGHRLLWSERPARSGLGWLCLPASTWPSAMAAPPRSGGAALLPSASSAGGHRQEKRASWGRSGASTGGRRAGEGGGGCARPGYARPGCAVGSLDDGVGGR